MTQIYIPGQGVTDLEGRALDRFVNEYDERLSFKRNPVTQDFCLYISMPRGSEPPEVPVMGFGPTMPSRDEVQRRLYQADTMRHGDAILNRMNAENDKLKAERTGEYDEAAWETTERMEKFMRKHGKSPVIKSLRPKRTG